LGRVILPKILPIYFYKHFFMKIIENAIIKRYYRDYNKNYNVTDKFEGDHANDENHS